MTTRSTSIALKGRWDEEAVIPSEACGRVEESVYGAGGCRCALPLFAVAAAAPVTVPVAENDVPE